MTKSIYAVSFLSIVFALGFGSGVRAVTLTDPGFESPVLSAGGFTHAGNPAWTFTNDAGVTRPFTNPTSTAVLNTWSATLSPIDGAQYASTYAGSDNITQTVSLAAGTYELSVYAAAPSGSVTIPPQPPLALVNGAFQLLFGGQNSAAINMPPGTDWQRRSATFTLASPGNVAVGVRNTVTASYFINYDAFSLTLVPEPTSFVLLAIGACALLRSRQRHYCDKKGC
jgi:HpiC1 cyclase